MDNVIDKLNINGVNYVLGGEEGEVIFPTTHNIVMTSSDFWIAFSFQSYSSSPYEQAYEVRNALSAAGFNNKNKALPANGIMVSSPVYTIRANNGTTDAGDFIVRCVYNNKDQDMNIYINNNYSSFTVIDTVTILN